MEIRCVVEIGYEDIPLNQSAMALRYHEDAIGIHVPYIVLGRRKTEFEENAYLLCHKCLFFTVSWNSCSIHEGDLVGIRTSDAKEGQKNYAREFVCHICFFFFLRARNELLQVPAEK